MLICTEILWKSELTLRVAKIPEKSTSLKLVFLTNLGVLQTFSANQTATNKQGIHGLLESGLPCTLNMVLHVNTMCLFGMERKYPTIPLFTDCCIILLRISSPPQQVFLLV